MDSTDSPPIEEEGNAWRTEDFGSTPPHQLAETIDTQPSPPLDLPTDEVTSQQKFKEEESSAPEDAAVETKGDQVEQSQDEEEFGEFVYSGRDAEQVSETVARNESYEGRMQEALGGETEGEPEASGELDSKKLDRRLRNGSSTPVSRIYLGGVENAKR
jgi:hypothetical protein